MNNMTCVLQRKCPLAISKWSKWRKVKTWTTLSTFFWIGTSKKRKKSRFLDFEKTYSRTMLQIAIKHAPALRSETTALQTSWKVRMTFPRSYISDHRPATYNNLRYIRGPPTNNVLSQTVYVLTSTVPKKCEFTTTIHIDAVTTPFDGT